MFALAIHSLKGAIKGTVCARYGVETVRCYEGDKDARFGKLAQRVTQEAAVTGDGQKRGNTVSLFATNP